MNKPNSTITELREAADVAEREAQSALQDRKAAIVRAAAALKVAGKARQRYLRALGNHQSEGNGDG